MFYAWIFFIVVFDQISKIIALRFLSGIDSLPIIPNIFHLTLVHNTGVAFGFFKEHPTILITLISLSLLFLILWSRTVIHTSRLAKWGMALILGGAIGNWIDRVRIGAVIDFLDFRVWPVFNLADTSICIGVGLYLILILRKDKPAERK